MLPSSGSFRLEMHLHANVAMSEDVTTTDHLPVAEEQDNAGPDTSPYAYIDVVIGMGFRPQMIVSSDGRCVYQEALIGRPSLADYHERNRLQDIWLSTPDRRATLLAAMDRRGLVHRS